MNAPIIKINEHGTKRYYLNGKLCRENGPAVIYDDGSKEWFNDKRHRVDGPAFEWRDGYKGWWINGKHGARSYQEQALHNETLKLGSIESFIDFVARTDILLIL